jgi:hypothetical protein
MTAAPRQRGLTFLETILGVAILALMTSTVMAAIAFIHRTQMRQRELLMCNELANRLILMYLDDPQSPNMPSELSPFGPYDGKMYRYMKRSEPVQIVNATPADPTAVAAGTNSASPASNDGGLSLDRLEIIHVRVWLAEDSGGSMSPGGNTPEATLSRMADPFAIFNRPDSARNMLGTPDGMRRLRDTISGGGRTRSTNPPGSTPRSAGGK